MPALLLFKNFLLLFLCLPQPVQVCSTTRGDLAASTLKNGGPSVARVSELTIGPAVGDNFDPFNVGFFLPRIAVRFPRKLLSRQPPFSTTGTMFFHVRHRWYFHQSISSADHSMPASPTPACTLLQYYRNTSHL